MLTPYLLKYAKMHNMEPVEGKYTYKDIPCTGWFLKAGFENKTLFCLDGPSREKILNETGENVKYLNKKGEDLTPTLFLRREGVPNKMTTEIVKQLEAEGCYVGEGWKSGLVLSYFDLNYLALGGCNNCTSLLNF